jgi:adenylate cyclase
VGRSLRHNALRGANSWFREGRFTGFLKQRQVLRFVDRLSHAGKAQVGASGGDRLCAVVAKVRSVCVPEVTLESRVPARTRHHAERVARQFRVLTLTARISAVISGFFGALQLITGEGAWWIGLVNVATATIFLLIPLLYRFGELVPPLTFLAVATASISLICWHLGTDSGLQFYFLVAAAINLVILGIDRLVLASVLAAFFGAVVIILEFVVPHNTGVQPAWASDFNFVLTITSAFVLVVMVIAYALREIARARMAMEAEYERSEKLLTNILPAAIAERLKDPSRNIIADKYDDASILFADIAGYTKRASDTTPTDLVRFLDRLYTDLDALVDLHGLEKVKTSGDSYMVVSGVPQPRADHVEALACLALDVADAVADLKDPQGRAVPLRIGLATGPVVAGVVGARKFFYDVWGDAVNVASRMETTDVEGRIQVPQNVYERLRDAFLLEERGDVDVKGKGVMHTWYLVGRRDDDAVRSAVERGTASSRVAVTREGYPHGR